MSWNYNDERWNKEFIPGITYRDLREKFGGLCRYNSGIDVTQLSKFDYQQLQNACIARRKHGNAPPINFRPITEKEASETLFVYSPIFSEYRQIYPWDDKTNSLAFNGQVSWPWEKPDYDGYSPPKGKYHHDGSMIAARFFYMSDGTGWAMSNAYWEGKVLWFKFGCNHEWGPFPKDHPALKIYLFRCEHRYYCIKCGHWHITDSSD